MSTPFDAIAARYEELWSSTTDGMQQRRQVWRELDQVFEHGQHILDLGCGTGDDAVHLNARGVRTTAIDASEQMAAAARVRGVDAQHLAIEDIGSLIGAFDGVLSNFGAFNCVADPTRAAIALAEKLRPGGTFAMCVLSRFYWRESLRYAFTLDFAQATRRWPGRASWRGIDVFYRTTGEWQRAFEPRFTLMKEVTIGGGDHRLYIWRRL